MVVSFVSQCTKVSSSRSHKPGVSVVSYPRVIRVQAKQSNFSRWDWNLTGFSSLCGKFGTEIDGVWRYCKFQVSSIVDKQVFFNDELSFWLVFDVPFSNRFVVVRSNGRFVWWWRIYVASRINIYSTHMRTQIKIGEQNTHSLRSIMLPVYWYFSDSTSNTHKYLVLNRQYTYCTLRTVQPAGHRKLCGMGGVRDTKLLVTRD